MDWNMQRRGQEQAKLPLNFKQQKCYDLELITMLVTTNTEFNFVKTDGFNCYMAWVAPKLTVKAGHCMSRELTPLLTRNVQSVLGEILSKELLHCKNVTFTTDEKQSRAEHPCLSLMMHFVNHKFMLWKSMIDCKSTEGLNVPAKLALIKNLISKIKGLKPIKKCACTKLHDCGMNKKVNESRSADHQLTCIYHVINNSLKAALAHQELLPLVTMANDLADGFNRSVKRSLLLRSTCKKLNIDYKKIRKPDLTRWNSLCRSIKAITEMALAFPAFLGSWEFLRRLSGQTSRRGQVDDVETLVGTAGKD